jgi:signal transduction histidine kinase
VKQLKFSLPLCLIWILWLAPGLKAQHQAIFLASAYVVEPQKHTAEKLAWALNQLSDASKAEKSDSAYSLLSDFGLATGNYNYALRYAAAAYDIISQTNSSPDCQFQAMLRYSTALEAAGDNETALNLWIRFVQRMEQSSQQEIAMASLANIVRLALRKNETGRASKFLSAVDTLFFRSLSSSTQFELKLQAYNLALMTGKNEPSEFDLLTSMVLNTKVLRNQVNLLRLADAGLASGFSLQSHQMMQRLVNGILDEKLDYLEVSLLFAQMMFQQASQTNEWLKNVQAISYLQKTHQLLQHLSNAFTEAKSESEAYDQDRMRKANLVNGASWLVVIVIVLLVMLVNYNIIKQFRNQSADLQQSIKIKQNEIKRLEGLEGQTDQLIDEKVAERIEAIKNELNLRKQLDNELTAALSEAEKANYLKNAFLANMSHEIRTPLNGILGFSSLLQNELALSNKNELFDYAQSIERSGERLLHLLNNIIDISRLEANDFEIRQESCNIHACLDHVIGTFQFKINEKGLKLVTDLEDCDFIGDASTLPRVFNELMDNALKYTDKGFIKIVSKKLPELQKVEIIIQDTGIGIDQAFLNQIFNPFRQDSLGYSKQYQGPGLGIPLTRKLVEGMGGTIEIVSEKLIGTSVILRFALVEDNNRPLAPDEIDKLPQRIIGRFSNALIVEDDASSRLILQKLLEKTMITVAAANGDEALQLVEEAHKSGQHFDLIMMDINLPSPWDGIKLKDYLIKNFAEYQNSFFIAQTAYAMEGDRDRFIQAGFDGYLSKPISRKALFTLIDQLSK